MKKDAIGKLTLSRETLRMLQNTELAKALGGITTAQSDVSGACTRQPACGNSTVCTSLLC